MADINAGNIFYTVTIDRASLKRVEDEIVNLTQQLKRRGGDIGALSEEMTKFGARLDETVSSMKKMTEAASEAGVSAELMRDGAQTASGALDVYTQSANEAKVSLERTAKANEESAVRIKRSQEATKQAAKASGDLAQRQANVSARLKEVVNNFKRTGQQAGVYVKKLTELRAEQLLVLRALRKQRNETAKAGGDTTELTNRIASLEGQLAKTNGELSKHGTRLTKVGTAAERVKIGMTEMKAAATDLQTSFASGMGVDKAAREYANFMQRSRELERQLLKQREGLDKDSQAMAENTQRLAQVRSARQKATDSAFQHGVALEQSGMQVIEVTQRAERLAGELEQLQSKFESGEVNASQFAESFNRLQGEVSQTSSDLSRLSGETGRTDAETKQLEGSTTRLTRAERNASRQTRKLSARFEQMGRSQQLSYAASTLLNDQIFQMSPALGILTNSMIFTTDSFAAFARQAAPIVAIAGGLIGVFQGIVASIKAGVGLESALEDVRKTTNLSSEGLEVLTQRFQTLSREIPVSVDEFLEMARVAGQLGITGVDNIERFATAVAKLGVATDVTGEQGAQALARFLQAVGTEAEDMGAAAERVSNILNELENTTASTAAEILQMTSYTQGLSSAAGFTEDQILALNSALLSLGVKAEAGGSAVVRTLDGIQQAATEGGDTLARMAEVSGMTAERFSEVALASPVDAFMALAEGMNEAAEDGENLSQLLSEMEVNEVRERRALLALAQGFDTLTAAMASAADQAILQNSIQAEVDIMAGKVESQVQLLKNQFAELAQDIGTALLPTVSRFLGVLNAVTDNMASFIATVTAASGALATFIAVASAKRIESFGVAISVLSRRNLRLLTRNLRTANGALKVLRSSLLSTRAAMGFIGIAITAAATAFAFFQTRASRAEKELEKLEERSDSLEGSFESNTGNLEALSEAFNDLNDVSGMQGFLGVITDLAGSLEGEASSSFSTFYEDSLQAKVAQGELAGAIESTREQLRLLFEDTLTQRITNLELEVTLAEDTLEGVENRVESIRPTVVGNIPSPFKGSFEEVSGDLRDLGFDIPEDASIGRQILEFIRLDEDEVSQAIDDRAAELGIYGKQVAGFRSKVLGFIDAIKKVGPELADTAIEAQGTITDGQVQLLTLQQRLEDISTFASDGESGGGPEGDGEVTVEKAQQSLQEKIVNAFEAQEFDPRVGFDANAKAQFLYDQIISGIQSEISSGNISAEQGEAMANELIGVLAEDLGVSLADELNRVPDDIARITEEQRREDIGQAVADSVADAFALEEAGVINTRQSAQVIADDVTEAARIMLEEGLISSEEYEQTIIELIENIEGADAELIELVERRAGVTEVTLPEVSVEEPGGSGRTQQQLDDLKELSDARKEYQETVAQANAEFEAGFITEEELLTRTQRALGVQIQTIIALDGDVSDLVQQYKELGEAIDNLPPPEEPPGKDEFEKATKGARNQTEALEELKEMYGDELPEGAEDFVDTFPDVDQAVVNTLDGINILADGLSKAVGLINSETNPTFAFLANTVAGVASGLTENIGQTVKMFEGLVKGGEGAGESVQFFAGILGNALPEQTSEANKALDALATTVGSAIGAMFGSSEAGAAIGGLVSNLVGDIGNAGKQIQETIDKVKESSALLSRSLISSFADSATEVQSRGGFLGLLGFTKKVVNEEELKELVSIAEGFAGTISDAIRAGIDSKLAGNQDWKEDLEGTLKEGIREALINSLIQAAVVAAEIEPFLEEVTRLIQEGSTEAAADYIEANYEEVVRKAIKSSEEVMALLPEGFLDEGPNFTEAGKFLGDSFGEALREAVKKQMGELDEDIHNTAMDISNSVANSVANALMTGIESYMMGEKDWEQALNDSITQSLIDAIVESFVNAAIIEGLMAEFLADFSTSVAKASQIEDEDERNAAYKQIFVDAGKDLDQIMKDANVLVEGFGNMAREAFGDQIASMEGAGDFEGAGTQISEITGPTRDLLVDLLTPLSIIPTWTGLIQDIRNDVRSIARGRNLLPSLPARDVQPIQMTQATTVSGGSVYNVNIGTIKTDSDNVRALVSDISKFTYKERRGGKK